MPLNKETKPNQMDVTVLPKLYNMGWKPLPVKTAIIRTAGEAEKSRQCERDWLIPRALVGRTPRL